MKEHDTMEHPPHSPDALLVSPYIPFEPIAFGIDVDNGLVDGKHVGIMTATVCAFARHQTWEHRMSPVTQPAQFIHAAEL